MNTAEIRLALLSLLNQARNGGIGITVSDATKNIMQDSQLDQTDTNLFTAKRKSVERALKANSDLFESSICSTYDDNCDQEPVGNQLKYWYKIPGNPPFEEDERTLAVALLNKFSKELLPPNLHASITAWLENKTQNHLWVTRVDSKSRYPEISLANESTPEAREIILKAMMKKRGFRAVYMDAPATVFYPVRLVQRERVSYMICCNDDASDAFKPYALHRFTTVTSIDNWSRMIADRVYQLSPAEIEKLTLTPTENEGLIKEGTILDSFDIRIFGMPAQHLSEITFHNKNGIPCTTREIIKTQDGRVTEAVLRSKDVPYTYELKCWILGLGRYARVEKPDNLKELIQTEISKMSEQYKNP